MESNYSGTENGLNEWEVEDPVFWLKNHKASMQHLVIRMVELIHGDLEQRGVTKMLMKTQLPAFAKAAGVNLERRMELLKERESKGSESEDDKEEE